MNLRFRLLLLLFIAIIYDGCKKDTKPNNLSGAYLVSGIDNYWVEPNPDTIYQVSNDTVYVSQIGQDSIFVEFLCSHTYVYCFTYQGMNYAPVNNSNNFCFVDSYCCNDTIRFFGSDSIWAYLYSGGLAGGAGFTLHGRKIQ